MGALSLSLPADIRNNRLHSSLYISAYNLGRISSYAMAGALAGAFGVEILSGLGLEQGSAHQVLRVAGVIFIVMIGLYLGGWFPQLVRLEKLGQPVWQKIQPLAHRLMPIKTPVQALLYGMLWGWLPCGLVYVVLLMSITAGSALQGALMMAVFGLGTLPSMLSAGVMLGWVRKLAQSTRARQIVAVLLIVMALAGLYLGDLYYASEAGHAYQH